MKVSAYANRIEPSATIAAGVKARELKAKGVNVFDFSLGEPDFNTPDHIQQAAIDAMKRGDTHYTPPSGIPALKQAICDYHLKQHGLKYEPTQVCVSSGAKHAIYTALCAVLGPGDEVIIPTPYWVSYSELVKMTGAVPVLVETSAAADFLVTPEQIKRACTSRTKLLMLNSPSNPTGTTYTPAQLAAIGQAAVEKDLIVMSDEIYERLIYGGLPFQAFGALGPAIYERTLTINGVSKAYAMTGWRIGWTCGPANIIKAMDNIQSQQTSNPCSISQHAAIAALKGDQGCVTAMLEQFTKRRDYVCQRLPKLPGLKLPAVPTGAFYAFIDVHSCFGKKLSGVSITDSNSFCLAALEHGHVNLVTGGAFGADGFARMSFACAMSTIEQGLDALEAWLKTGA